MPATALSTFFLSLFETYTQSSVTVVASSTGLEIPTESFGEKYDELMSEALGLEGFECYPTRR
ncbi:hypothetical protein RRF57_000185 [Xylaria bambusicola]|uniref:Uncharacterized protein n=1 Tax=Xylaria bambusicola TaxID=326684 RepID=A0AAN7UN57_9PEZI